MLAAKGIVCSSSFRSYHASFCVLRGSAIQMVHAFSSYISHSANARYERTNAAKVSKQHKEEIKTERAEETKYRPQEKWHDELQNRRSGSSPRFLNKRSRRAFVSPATPFHVLRNSTFPARIRWHLWCYCICADAWDRANIHIAVDREWTSGNI